MTPKPVEQPRGGETPGRPVEIHPLVDTSGSRQILNNKPDTLPIPSTLEHFPSKKQTAPESFRLDFFGWECDFPKFSGFKVPILKAISNIGISDFYQELTDQTDFEGYVEQISGMAGRQNLNGWATLLLVETLTSKFELPTNQQILFSWILLKKLGYRARVGYRDDHVFLLVSVDSKVYFTPSIKSGELVYIIRTYPGQSFPKDRLFSYPDSPNQAPANTLSLRIESLPILGKSLITRKLYYNGDTIQVPVNRDLVNFYGSYPNCELTVQSNTPLSQGVARNLETYLVPKMSAMNDLEKVNLLLRFVQYGLEYKTDQQQFGREDWLFPEETLFYPFSDCDDRACFLAQLVKQFLGLPSVGLSYSDHVSVAIAMDGIEVGYYIPLNGKKFWVCDPSLIGGRCGDIMKEYREVQPEVIFW
jgi:hypothetical protein